MGKLPNLLACFSKSRWLHQHKDKPEPAGPKPSHSVDQLRAAVLAKHRDLFDFQLKNGESPEQAYRILNGAQYAQVSGSFIRMFAYIEAQLLMVCLVADAAAGKLEDKYEFSVKERVKQTRKKLNQCVFATPEKDAALRSIDDIGTIADLRQKMMHWLCEGYAMPGDNFVFRNISPNRPADGWKETVEYSLFQMEQASATAERVFADLNAFVLRHAPPEGIIPAAMK